MIFSTNFTNFHELEINNIHVFYASFKQWLAKVGYERIQETVDPEQSLEHAGEITFAQVFNKKIYNPSFQKLLPVVARF
jgi:N-acetylglutamate synthase-like GNAT family acetyltransferase